MNEYGTLSQLKMAVEPRIEDTLDDDRLQRVLEVASRSVDAECGRFFYKTPSGVSQVTVGVEVPETTEVLDVGHDVVSISAVKVGATVDTATVWSGTYRLEPLDTAITGHPYTTLRAITGSWSKGDTVWLTGVFGWPVPPVDIQHATVQLAARLWKRAGSPLGVAGFGEMGPVYVRNTDPDIARLLAPYRKVLVG